MDDRSGLFAQTSIPLRTSDPERPFTPEPSDPSNHCSPHLTGVEWWRTHSCQTGGTGARWPSFHDRIGANIKVATLYRQWKKKINC